VSTHPSSLTIDALAAGHLTSAEAAQARAHVETCARCSADVAAAEAACATFTREVLPRTIGNLRPPARATPAGSRWWRSFGPALLVPALAAAVLLIWIVRRPDSVATHDDDDIRIKGALTFQVFANRGGEVIAVHDGARLAAGDSIRFVVGARGPAYLLVASIDGAGKATIYYPYGGTRSGPVGKQPSELPGSIVLDAAPGPERVFALVSAEPLEADVVIRAIAAIGARGAGAIRATRTLDVPASAQASVVFEKVTP
jgi:hypothetical protein